MNWIKKNGRVKIAGSGQKLGGKNPHLAFSRQIYCLNLLIYPVMPMMRPLLLSSRSTNLLLQKLTVRYLGLGFVKSVAQRGGAQKEPFRVYTRPGF